MGAHKQKGASRHTYKLSLKKREKQNWNTQGYIPQTPNKSSNNPLDNKVEDINNHFCMLQTKA